MLQGWFILVVSFAYLCLLFGIAYYGDKRADQGRTVINAYVYALSLAVYCTSWTSTAASAERHRTASGSCRSTSARR